MKARHVLSAGVIVGLLVVSGHAISDTRTARIIGGEISKPATYPWMVSLQSEKEGDHFCGASLIADRWVLSASHCHEGEPVESLFAVVGEYDLKTKDEGQKRVGIKRIIKADSRPNGDMMLLELKEPVQSAKVLLADDTLMSQLKTGDMFTVMGWGNRAGDQSEDFPVKLHQVNVPLYNKEECKNAYNAIGQEVDDTMICAGYKLGGKDSCQGDSGGPLVLQRNGKWYQTGVVSFGEGCALANYPGVYTRVATFNQWINEQISQANGLSINQTSLGLIGVDSELTHSITLTNNGQAALSVQGIALQGDTGFQINSDKCTSQVLESKQQCIVEIKTQFTEAGKKSATMQVSTTDSHHPQWDYTMVVEVLPKADFSGKLANGLNWYVGASGQWALESGDNNSQQLTSTLNDQFNETLLMTQIKGEGTLTFEWMSGDVNNMELLLLVNGEAVDAFNATENFSTVTHTLKPGNHSVAWLLQARSDRSLQHKAVDSKVRVKSVAFKAAGSNATAGTPANTGGGSGGGSTGVVLPLMLLLLAIRKKTQSETMIAKGVSQ